jgi:hypothetical protein
MRYPSDGGEYLLILWRDSRDTAHTCYPHLVQQCPCVSAAEIGANMVSQSYVSKMVLCIDNGF